MSTAIHKAILANIVLVFGILCLHTTAETRVADFNWNCADSVEDFEFDVDLISGVWYEVARVPSADVPACVKLTAPPTLLDDNYIIQVDYVNNVNKQWRHTIENLHFPWDNNTKNGIFILKYGSDPISLSINFKLVATDYNKIAIVCGYSAIAMSYNMLKIMTRETLLDPQLVNMVQSLADKYNMGSQLTWVEQSERCNGVFKSMPNILPLIAFIYGTFAFMK